VAPARFPYTIFGALGGFTGGWMAWIQAVTIAPIEVEATLGYINSRYPGLHLINANGTLDSKGIAIGAGFLLVFTIINILGVRWLAETNTIATYWKIAIPTITIVALLFAVFRTGNFSAGGGFAPYGFHGIFSAFPLGMLCPLAFMFANCIVYFAGWSNVFWLYVFIVVGFAIFGIYQAARPAERRTAIEWRSAYWIIPWLAGLGVISWPGQYPSSVTTVFDLMLNPTLNIGQWWDLGLIAIFSLAIFYWATRSGMSRPKVIQAVEAVEAEASVELATPLT
jgi:hypothetical protein